jgi:hypothetical protein
MSEDDVLSLTRKLKREPNIDTAIDIITWELGDLRKCETYKEWHPNLSPGYIEEQKKALGGIVFQSMVIARLLDTTIDEIIDLGFENVKERIKDMKAGSGRFTEYVGEDKH